MDVDEFKQIRKQCLDLTKQKIRDSVDYDTLIIQTISSIDEIEPIVNKIITRVREWYSWHNPEFSRKLSNPDKFIELILKKDKKTLLNEINVKESMGKDFGKDDLDAIFCLAEQAQELVKTRDKEKNYLEKCLKKHCPNLLDVLGVSLSAKVIKHTGSLKKLAMIPAPVIQIMGAEKALFKHLSKKGKSPKYGMLFAHPLIGVVDKRQKGKMARAIADKAAIAARLDLFKGEYMGPKFKILLEKKAKELNN